MLDFTKEYSSENHLAEGWYDVRVEGAEYKTSKSSGIDYLNLKFKTANGKILFNIYNIFNKNDMARNIAMGEIKQILTLQGADITKLAKLQKEELLGILMNGGTFQVALGVKEDSYGIKNTFKKYKKSDIEIKSATKPSENNLPF